MKIKTSSFLANASVIVLIIITFIALISTSKTFADIRDKHRKNEILLSLAMELRISSLNLSENVRVYVTTGDIRFKDAYYEIIDIRSGLKPRSSTSSVAASKIIPLLDLFKEYGITNEEYALLEEISKSSEDIIALEIEAMNAIEGRYKDSSGKYTIIDKPDREKAISLVFNEQYRHAIAQTLRPLDNFANELSHRTHTTFETLNKTFTIELIIALISLGITLLVAIKALFFIRKRIVQPLETTTAFAQEIAAGNREKQISIIHMDELGILRQSLNTLVISLQNKLKKIKNANERTQLMLDTFPMGANYWNQNLEIIDCNYEIMKIAGYTSKEEYLQSRIIPYSSTIERSQEYQDTLYAAVRKAFKTGYEKLECTTYHKDGYLIPVERTFIRVKSEDGEDALVGYMVDLREQKKMLHEIEEANARTQIMLNTFPIGANYWNKDLKVVDCNLAAVTLAGFTSKIEYLKYMDEVYKFPIEKEFEKKIIETIKQAFISGYEQFEWISWDREGNEIPVDRTLIRVKNAQGEDVIISYMRDLREQKKILQELTDVQEHLRIMEEMTQESIRQKELLEQVRNGLEEKEFQLFYQPKFDIDSMHVVGAEALIRWFKDGDIIPPDTFIPILEQKGLITRLDFHVIEMACLFISPHREYNLPNISINISGATIIKKELVKKLLELVNKYDVAPQALDIEITETALVDNFDLAISQLLELRQHGFTISMDDFGTGVSSLNRLSKMPLDTIKLDRVFLMDAFENPKSTAIVQLVIELAKKIGAKTVAEGIETKEQLEFLRDLSCEHGQGYFYARPMKEAQFLELLNKKV